MDNVSNEQIQKVLADFSSIKEAIRKNTSIIRSMDLYRPFRILSLGSGLAITVLSLVLYGLERRYGSYAAIPGTAKVIFFGIIGIFYALIGAGKGFFFLKSGRQINPRISLWMIAKEYLGLQAFHIKGAMFALLIFALAYFIREHQYAFIVPVISCGFGALLINEGVMLCMGEIIFGGYWMLVWGMVLAVVLPASPFPGLAVSLGLGWLITALAMFARRNKTGEA